MVASPAAVSSDFEIKMHIMQKIDQEMEIVQSSITRF
jgi:hypothetical protein